MPAWRQIDSPPRITCADLLDRELVDRHRHQGQRHDRPAAHRVDVADRVGRGDAAEVERVVDDRHEEVGGRDQRLLVVEPVDRGVVGGLDADHQLGRHDAADARAQDLATARRARSCSRSRRRGRSWSGEAAAGRGRRARWRWRSWRSPIGAGVVPIRRQRAGDRAAQQVGDQRAHRAPLGGRAKERLARGALRAQVRARTPRRRGSGASAPPAPRRRRPRK